MLLNLNAQDKKKEWLAYKFYLKKANKPQNMPKTKKHQSSKESGGKLIRERAWASQKGMSLIILIHCRRWTSRNANQAKTEGQNQHCALLSSIAEMIAAGNRFRCSRMVTVSRSIDRNGCLQSRSSKSTSARCQQRWLHSAINQTQAKK